MENPYTVHTADGPRTSALLLLPALCRAGVTDLQHTKHKFPPSWHTFFVARRQNIATQLSGAFFIRFVYFEFLLSFFIPFRVLQCRAGPTSLPLRVYTVRK